MVDDLMFFFLGVREFVIYFSILVIVFFFFDIEFINLWGEI